MFDGSRKPLAQNIDETAQVAALAHAARISCEGEIGFVGYSGGEGSAGTDPEEAAIFARETGIDAMAISVGNVHLQTDLEGGLDEVRIRAIEALTQVPLVIHGGSGVPYAQRAALAAGSRIAKFNIGTELRMAFGAALRKAVNADPAIGAAGDVDTAAVILTTTSGRICQISNSRRASYGYDQRIEVHGATGMLRADNQLESTVEIATQAGFRRDPAQNFFLERYEAAYLAEMRAFVQAATGADVAEPGIGDGLQAQILADAATLSCETRQPVGLPAG